MSDENPVGIKGRKFQDDGVWHYVVAEGVKILCKITGDELKKAYRKEYFDVYHALAPSSDGSFSYMPALIGTVDPWVLNGALCATITPLHHERGEALDNDVRRSMQVVQEIDKKIVIATK